MLFLQQGELQLESARRDLHRKQELVQRGLVILNSITEQPMPGNEKNSSSSLDSVSKIDLRHYYSLSLSMSLTLLFHLLP